MFRVLESIASALPLHQAIIRKIFLLPLLWFSSDGNKLFVSYQHFWRFVLALPEKGFKDDSSFQISPRATICI
jgi:hypothetical protein